MKILHTADWHLGQTFYEYDRREEHFHFLEWLKQQIKQQEKLAFDKKLIASRLGFADFVICIHAGGNFCIKRQIRSEKLREVYIPGEQWLKEVTVAGVCFLGNQNIWMKDNIFVFHRCIFKLFNRVKLSRKNQRNRSFFHRVLLEVYRNLSFSFLDVDDFHLIVPV